MANLPFPDTGNSKADRNFLELEKLLQTIVNEARGTRGSFSHFSGSADLTTHEADTSTHGSADLSQAALKNAANTFTETQEIKPTTDTRLLNLTRGTDASPTVGPILYRNAAQTADLFFVTQRGGISVKPDAEALLLNLTRGTDTAPTTTLIRVRNKAETTTLFSVDANGKVFGTGLDASSQKVTSVATPTLSTDAATKGYVDTAGGGHPQTVDIGPTITAPADTLVPGADSIFLALIYVYAQHQPTGVRLWNGTVTTAIGQRAAIYSLDGNTRHCNRSDNLSGAPGTSAFYDVPFTTTTTLDRGAYWLRVSLTTATGRLAMATPMRNGSIATGGTVSSPATITPPTSASNGPQPLAVLY